jgi:diguanylate cyclase
MPRQRPRLDPDRPSGLVPRDPIPVEPTSHRWSIVPPAGPEELQRRLAAIDGENRDLTAQVRRLEAELDKRSSELAGLRGHLRSAVRDSLTDPLTGLANRRSFDLKLEAAVTRAGRQAPACLVMADIDHFKRINDAHGHDIGDEVLRIVGRVLHANIRDGSVIARVGGDEFGVLFQGHGAYHAAEIAHRLCGLMAGRQVLVRGRSEVVEHVTVSLGVAAWDGRESSARWLARADATLFEAKRRGRNRVAFDQGHPILASPGAADDGEGPDRRSCAAVWPSRADEAAISSDPLQPARAAPIRRNAR